ncbi:MAG: class I SAM-dependent methyltransferase [Gemmatimonas sp.]
MKLNIGCGHRKIDGFVNVDKFAACAPDLQLDIEITPWPWPTSSVEEIRFIHALEHMGQDVAVFLAIMQEIYRVLVPGGRLVVHVPHPRNDDFLGDPTHVRAITAQQMRLFDRRLNDEWKASGRSAATPLAHYLGVDFEMVEMRQLLEPRYAEALQAGRMTYEEIGRAAEERNNVVAEIHMTLVARKG